MMKKNLLLKNLESVTNYSVYSKTNNEYEKVLGNFTLKSFLKSLKNPKKIKKLTFLEKMAEKYPDEENPSYQYSALKKKRIKLKEIFNNLNNENIQNTNTIKIQKNSDLILYNKKPILIDITPNPCTYNPKYDLIFKRIPVATIYNTPKKINNYNINNSSENKENKLKKISKDKKYNLMSYKNNKIKRLKLDDIKTFNKKIDFISNKNEFLNKKNDNIQKEIIKNKILLENKMTTDKYIIRKKIYAHSHENKINNDINNIIKINKTPNSNRNYLYDFIKNNKISKTQNINFNKNNIKKNSIFKTSISNKSNENNFNNETNKIYDFNKMSKRNFEIILNNSILKNHSFYHYEPKFDYITQSSKAFNFGFQDNKTNFQKKKYLLKKMWCSYANLSKEYNLINNSKLKNNTEK